MNKVLILGGSGNFGKRIAERLSKKGIEVILAGRNQENLKKIALQLNVDFLTFDVKNNFDSELKKINPKIKTKTKNTYRKK